MAAVGLAAVALGWYALGVHAIRLDRPTGELATCVMQNESPDYAALAEAPVRDD